MPDEFTFETTGELMNEIGRGILGDGDFVDDGWSAIALVVQIEGAIASHGFKYYTDGRIEPAARVAIDTKLKFVTLADQMERLNGKRWKTCLVQIAKPAMKIRMQYEYEDINRWMVTPANLDEMRESLRPA